MKKEDFLEQYKTIPVDLLLKIAISKKGEYVQEAIKAAKEELKNRGVNDPDDEEEYLKNYYKELENKTYEELMGIIEDKDKVYNEETNNIIKIYFKNNLNKFSSEGLARFIVNEDYKLFDKEVLNSVKDELISRKKTQIKMFDKYLDERSNVFIFKCPKCSCYEHVQGEIRTVTGALTQMFDIQSQPFVSISCENCGYTEFYKVNVGKFLNSIIDLMIG
jgi:hypothetical protein